MKEEALKLADILEGSKEPTADEIFESADMIRKLVAKIEVTERDYNFMYSYAKGLEQVEKDLKAELDKQGEPVFEESNEQVVNAFYKQFPEMKPQTKPLSDEEILKLYKECMESPYTHQQSYFGFARAIEKAHGIK